MSSPTSPSMPAIRKNTNATSRSSSPESDPPSKAILPSALAEARAKTDTARRVSNKMLTEFEKLEKELGLNLEQELESNAKADLSESERQKQLRLVTLGLKVSKQGLKETQSEKDLLYAERDAGLYHHKTVQERDRVLTKRWLSTGETQWRQTVKKLRLENDGPTRLTSLEANQFSQSVLSIYRKADRLEKSKRKRNTNWRSNTIDYYDGKSSDKIWCHIIGSWLEPTSTKAAHIVPHFLDPKPFGEMLFGSKVHALDGPSNSLLMSNTIKNWFDKYLFVIVPADITEEPIRKWKAEVISPSIKNTEVFRGFKGSMINQKELSFRNENRPAARFLYLHFIMTLIRHKDSQQPGWEDFFARYRYQRPFPTPTPYMRYSMMLALANQFKTTDLTVMEEWISDYSFDSHLKLNTGENEEIARQIRDAVEKKARPDGESEDGESEDGENEDGENEEYRLAIPIR